jgi:protein-tyrosine-phosphatase
MTVATEGGVLFVDLGNTCRSVFAQYFAQQHRAQRLPTRWIESAGIDEARPPDPASPAIRTLRDAFEIDAGMHKPRCVRYLAISAFRFVVAIDNPGSDEVALAISNRGVAADRVRRWSVSDPWGDPDRYRESAEEVLRLLAQFRSAEFG